MKKVELQNITLSITDGKHGDCEGEENSGYYFISCKDVYDSTVHYEDARQITEKDYSDAHRRTKLEPFDILVTNSGTIGRMALVKDVPETYRTTFQKSVAIIKPNQEVIRPTYLYYCLLNCVNQFISQSNGSAQKNLLLGTMRKFQLCVEETFERQDIVANILMAYDSLIENNQKQIKLLEEAAQRLYKEWFVDLRFPGYEDVPVVDGVPEGWGKDTVANVSSVLRRGISPQYADCASLRVINQKCIRTSIVDLSEARTQEKSFSKEMSLQDSDTVICSTGAGTLGRVGQVFGTYPNVTFDSHVTLVRANSVAGKQYLYHYLKSKQLFLMGMGKGSTNQLELGRGTIQDLPILAPNAQVVQGFEQCTQPIHDKISVLVSEIERLRDVRDSLLPKLMSGELEV